MIIRKAKIEEADRVAELFDLARRGMASQGIDQWQGATPNKESFLSDYEKAYATVCEENGKVIAYCALVLGDDPTYYHIDGAWKTDNKEYGILHRVTTDPEYRGRGIASAFMNYCFEKCREAGLTSCRIDTHKDNLGMQHTILKNGYEYCGIIIIDDGTERLAYEKLL
ncbi:MAG: GNAT family N-acetyltransferase [Clostridia bacterium]|nr:GNAT family N-acetyltransferase [Clostridia bacterium]